MQRTASVETHALRCAQRILRAEGRLTRVRVSKISDSIGVAYYPQDTDDILDLLHSADKAIYENKSFRKRLILVTQTSS